MSFFDQFKDRAEEAAGDACRQMMMEQAEDKCKDLLKIPGDDKEDKDDGGDNKALRMAGKFASSFLGEDKDEGSMVGKFASGFLGEDKDEGSVVGKFASGFLDEDKKEDSGLDVKNFFGGLPKLF